MARNIETRLTIPQEEFVMSPLQFPAFVGGFGAGKSEALITRLLVQKLKYPHLDVGYFAPTFDLVRLIGFSRFEEKLDQWKIPYKLNKSDRQIHFWGSGSVIFRSLENPNSIIGFELADAGIDELDTLKPAHAANAWNKVIARCRQKKPDGAPNTAAVATTPEGFRFVYERWHKIRGEQYKIYRAPTYSNPYLPSNYVESLRLTYPPNLLDAYIEGKFVNLTQGSVYPDFDRIKNHADVGIEPGEQLHVGADFNVYNCTAIVCVIRNGMPFVVREHTGLRDTPAMVTKLTEEYGGKHEIFIYPDATGRSHKSVNATVSDLQLLKNGGFHIRAKDTNPLVRDRVVSVNQIIHSGDGVRSLMVNTQNCKVITECLEQQVYDKHGDPDKEGGKDHGPDALGYFLYWHWPVRRPVAAKATHIPFMNR